MHLLELIIYVPVNNFSIMLCFPVHTVRIELNIIEYILLPNQGSFRVVKKMYTYMI